MLRSITELPWLPPPPADFLAQCKLVSTGDGPAGQKLQQLACHRLTGAMAASLSRAIVRCRNKRIDLKPLSDFRLGILSGSTLGLLVSGLPAAAARHGVLLEVVAAPYGQVVQEALNPSSITNSTRLDGVLLALDHHWFQFGELALNAAGARVSGALESLHTILDGLSQNGGGPAIILQTLPIPPLPIFGGYDPRVAGTPHAMIQELNRRIYELADQRGAYVLDTAGLATRIGTDHWFDPVKWHAFKLPFSPECIGAYADTLGRLLGAIRGKAKKCLVLDLDNTCWGGVIGDDGVAGIDLGQGSPLGEAFLAVQRMALELRQRGVILAVSSKNDEDVARQPFREHPDMLLTEDDIAVFQANWNDKPSNLEAIARTLNIGVDALVLLDDNPAERVHVRAALPMVGVPELPEDPSWYPVYLAAAGYFEAVAFSEEDALRATSYATDTKRAEMRAGARDLGDYLAALRMVISFTPFDATGRQRIAQLVNKTNQFNLTTRRYSEAEIASMEADPAIYTLQIRLADAWSDLGMISVVVCREVLEGTTRCWDIDTWLMSCRALGRKVEEATLAEIAAEARRRGIARLNGTYIPTAKNGIVRDHYTKLGFVRDAEEVSGQLHFRMPLVDFVEQALPMEVRRIYTAQSAPEKRQTV